MYYGYIRVSTETQRESGYGLEEQLNEINAYAKEKGICIERIFRDEGISGAAADDSEEAEAIEKRKGLIEMLSLLKEGDIVIIKNTSRLWRADMSRVVIKREFLKRKAIIQSIEQPRYNVYSKDPNDYFLNAVLEALDVYERMTISIRLASGRTTKAQKGDKPAGIAPYGYRHANDGHSIEINPDEAAHVKQIFSDACKGISLRKIADNLNSKGISTHAAATEKRPNAGKWSAAGVAVILHNDFYTGIVTHKGEKISGNHQAIISKVVYGKAQAALSRRAKR